MIRNVKAAQRLDSRGNPTVQVDLIAEKGTFRALVPSGVSTGQHEAVELRDGNKGIYGGKGVKLAVKNVEQIIGPALVKEGFRLDTDLKKIDVFLKELDGSKNKSKLGGNAILGVSMACARAGAAVADVPLYEFLRRESGSRKPSVMPVPFFNVLNGGRHSGNEMAFQEIMFAPVGADSMAEAVRMGSEVYQQLKKVITEKFGSVATGIGDEGGFAPPITYPHEALDLLVLAVAKCGYTERIKFAMDPASSEFFDNGKYHLGFKGKVPDTRTATQLQQVYRDLLDQYPIVLLEDPFAEDDWQSWSDYHRESKIELVGDDLLVTNTERVQEAQEKKACNAMLLKVNQIGTVSEAIAAAHMAYRFDWSVFVSHRSGETTDDFIADLSVGLRSGHLKSGAPARGERVAKYNRLMDIEAELKAIGEPCIYAGARFRSAHSL